MRRALPLPLLVVLLLFRRGVQSCTLHRPPVRKGEYFELRPQGLAELRAECEVLSVCGVGRLGLGLGLRVRIRVKGKSFGEGLGEG